jgi:glycolate oxidase FAD binding subunit
VSSVANLSDRLEKLLGRDRVRTSEAALREFAIAERTPMAVLKPRSTEEVGEIVSFAVDEKLAVVACGSRSKLQLGKPPQRYDLALDMTDLRQIAHYDAGDLTVSVDAGIRLNELAKALAAENQFLPLSAPCSATSTAGGTIASGIDSTLRQQYGTARDFLIGAEFVDGTGKQCKSGGRVVKSVTGYDLHKLLIGSLGTLGIITRLNFRTFPLPELRSAHLAGFPAAEAALNFHISLLKSGLPLSNLELFDSEFSALLVRALNKSGAGIRESLAANEWHVFASFEGSAALTGRIAREVQALARQAQAARSETLDAQSSQPLSDALRETFDWLRRAAPSVALLRTVLPQFTPGDMVELQRSAQQSPVRSAVVLRACNVAYLTLLADNENAQTNAALESGISELFSRVEVKKGNATLLHAPLRLKDRVNVWGTKRVDFSLMQRVKQAFDPQNIFAPGRFVGGI